MTQSDRQIREHETSEKWSARRRTFATTQNVNLYHSTALSRNERLYVGRKCGRICQQNRTTSLNDPISGAPPARPGRRSRRRPTARSARSVRRRAASIAIEQAAGRLWIEAADRRTSATPERRSGLRAPKCCAIGPSAAGTIRRRRVASALEQRHRGRRRSRACTPLAAAISDAWPIETEAGDVGARVDRRRSGIAAPRCSPIQSVVIDAPRPRPRLRAPART